MKVKFKKLTALLLCLCALPILAENREYLKLDSHRKHGGEQEWKMMKAQEVKATGAEVSSVGFSTEGWAEATVPGTVLSNLVENGVYPEPYFGRNNKISQGIIPDLSTAGREFYTYWFRTEFQIPENFKGKRIWLEPMGINYRAEIWLNGQYTASMAGMFNSLPIDITDLVKPGEKSSLAIRVYPVDIPGVARPKAWGAKGEPNNGGDGWIGRNVTQLMTVGWDFTYKDGIRDRNTGIWRSIRLYTTGRIQLREPFVKSELSHPNYDKADETVTVEAFNPGESTYEFFVTARIPEAGISVEKKVQLFRGEHGTVEFNSKEFPELLIQNPQLWWPKNKGKQNLYTLILTARDLKDNYCDSISTRFGIREVQAIRDTPDQSKLFVINGHKTFVRGSNWIPEAMQRTDDQRMETEMAYTDQSGINLLRLWGGGIAESDRFYELCDQYGIMVWQEFWMTGDTRHPQDEALYLANVANTIKRIRNHPSIVFNVSSNESTCVSGAEQLIRSLHPVPYQMQSECDGVHDGSPYKQVNPMQHYENTASERGSRVDGFNPEYGAPTLPIVESLRQMMPAEDLFPLNKETWDYMDGGGFHLMSTMYNDMVNEYGESQNIEEYARRGQLVGAMNSKSIWEVWNQNKLQYGDRWCSGLLFWYHNCPNYQVSSRMWDWLLEPTASLYHTMHSMEPLHVQYDYLTNQVSVINDYLEPYSGLKVTARVYNMDSKCVSKQQATCEVPSDGVANNVLNVSFPEKLSQIHFIALTLEDSKGNTLSRNFYWRSLDKYEGAKTLTGPCTSGFQTLSSLPAAHPSIKISKIAQEDGKNAWQATIKNKSNKIAFFCQLLLTDEKGHPLHGSYYSDNFITLLPGETQTILLRTPYGGEKVNLLFNEGLNKTKIIEGI